MSAVFVSYSHKDKLVVQDVVRVIRGGGFDVWLDIERINSNTDFDSQIYEALQTANYIIACVSGAMMAITDMYSWSTGCSAQESNRIEKTSFLCF
jgi:hypothetical protein